ncbi:MAG TPA: radical SAM protein [Actinophytocola sp.]|uniref:B12-binding domain-containing radical SAM protein n=1 Tax=Actinophytocola sp. TaxID=1872138 RepID=UPI002DB6B72E|nr:radical SAM protein [Actinophytocola sp.]HEU5475179.1 radical SAM protein [Actinophytocola sp.]
MRAEELSVHDRLLRAVAHASVAVPGHGMTLRSVPLVEPNAIRTALGELVGEHRAVVTGTLDRRLILIEHQVGRTWTIADLSGRRHNTRAWPPWTTGHLTIAEPDTWLSAAEITPEGQRRLLRPRLLLASLYHPEYFPLPRFPLAISDLARAARSTLLGQVELMDMQLGLTMDDIVGRVRSGEVDVLGVSVSFGQHDLAVRLLDEITSLDNPPMVVAGGSLTVRNERILLERYPNLLIGRGAGEPTIADVLAHWHGDLEVEQVRGAGYRGAARGRDTLSVGRFRHTAIVANRMQTDIWPELDLLDRTFAHHGVAQLETSRGCTNFCSFCPRGHKGQWAGAEPGALPWILREMRAVLDRYPHLSRTVYLVDEEFVGRGEDAVTRALSVADTLAEAGFSWETSCRIDQVVRLDRDRSWHVERGHLWRGLVERKLRRCLFGVESGVTSILERFNKETTGDQNALAIRTLTALGVPPRFTYITFDQLMTGTELRETYSFQGRTDLLLRPQPELTVAEIIDGVRDEQWVAEHSTGRRFYTGISYMLVGMECLIGAAYTRKAEAAGLTGQVDPSMGRVEATYADWRIGTVAHWSQLWIDRNFALDYTLKSLEKILDGPPYEVVRDLRRMLKDAAYQLLGEMTKALDRTDTVTSNRTELATRCAELAETMIRHLHIELDPAVAAVHADLPVDQRSLLLREYGRWLISTDWQLINAADPCGT